MFIQEQGKRPVLNGRPLKLHGDPIGLFHPVFNKFQSDMNDSEHFRGNEAIYSQVRHLFKVFADIYSSESERVQRIEAPLRSLLGRKFTVENIQGVKSDGVMTQACGESIAYLVIQEIKCEIGMGHSDPYTQGTLAYRKYWTSRKSD